MSILVMKETNINHSRYSILKIGRDTWDNLTNRSLIIIAIDNKNDLNQNGQFANHFIW